MLGSKLEVDEDLAGTSRVLPLRPSVSVWDVLACWQAGGQVGERGRLAVEAQTHTHRYSIRYIYIMKTNKKKKNELHTIQCMRVIWGEDMAFI